jgi:hypothetical protein
MARIRFQTEGNEGSEECIWILPTGHRILFVRSFKRETPSMAESPTQHGACFPQVEKESAATLVRVADCKLRLDLAGLFAYGANCSAC